MVGVKRALEQREQRREPAQRDAHLVHALGLDAFERGALVDLPVAQAILGEKGEGIVDAGVGRQFARARLMPAGRRACHHCVAARRLAARLDLKGGPFLKLERDAV